MESLWHWTIIHWKEWGINGIVAGAASTITWILARRKEWKEQRRLKAEQRIEERVLDAMKGDTSRIFPIRRDKWFQASDLAKALDLAVDVVFDGLERLERKRRVRRGGTMIPGYPPSWALNPRQ
jgi:hypothetical protein